MWIRLDEREHAAVMAGLRLIQAELPRAEFLPQGVQPIFDNEETIDPLKVEEIDTLCERINTREDAAGWIEKARENYASDEINIDDDAVLSESDDGAFVSAWVWVSNEEMGIELAKGD